MRYLVLASLLLLMACAVGVSASSMFVDFDSYAAGTISGQNGWFVQYPGTQDETVTAMAGMSGSGAWRISNLYSNGIVVHAASPALSTGAGEPSTGAVSNVFHAEFYWKTASAGDNSMVQVSPDNGTGSRWGGRLDITNFSSDATFDSHTVKAGVQLNWDTIVNDVDHYVASPVLNAGEWYRTVLDITFVPGTNSGSPNDIVTIKVYDSANNLVWNVNSAAGASTWESAGYGGNGIVDRLIWRTKWNANHQVVDGSLGSPAGFYFDNLSLSNEKTYTVTPKTLATGADFSAGLNPFSYDTDSIKPITASGAPSGFGASSFYANVVNGNGGAGAANRYRTLRISLPVLFGHGVKVRDVKSLSYQTNKPAGQTGIDWRFSIYTAKMASNNAGSWYGDRIQSTPSNSRNISAPANQWNQWSTDVGTNQLQWGTPGTAGSGLRQGFASENILWSDLTSGPVTRGNYTWDFSAEDVSLLDIIMGANSGGGTGSSKLDDVRIELTDGEVAVLDLGGNVLSLEPSTGSIYVQPGHAVNLTLKQADLAAPAVGYQAFVSFDTSKLTFTSGTYTASPYAMPVIDPIAVSGANIDLAAGALTQTGADASLANLVFSANTGVGDSVTKVTFRQNDPASQFTDSLGYALIATLVDSANICIDGTAPTITGLQDKSVNTDSGKPYATVALGTPTVSDNLSGVASVTNNGPALSHFVVGTTTVIWSATDNAGNTSTAAQLVTVADNENPTITAPAAVTVNTDPGLSTASGVVLGTAATSDNVGVTSVTNNAPAVFPLGQTTVTWTVTDAAGNHASATQTVTVVDNQNPVITCAQNYTGSTDPGKNFWTPYIETFDTNPDTSATGWFVDRYAPAAFNSVAFDGGNRLHIGISAADFQDPATRGFYNTQGRAHAFLTGAVTKISGELYVGSDWALAKRRSDIWGTSVDGTGKVVDYPIIGCTSEDPTDKYGRPSVAPRFRVWDENSGWVDLSGTVATGRWYKFDIVMDAGKWDYYIDGSSVATVSKAAGNKLSSVILQAFNYGESYDVYWDNVSAASVLSTPTATDNVGIVSLNGVRTDGKSLTDPYPFGVTTINWTALDAAGLSATCAQTITVEDHENPTITAPAALTDVPTDLGEAHASKINVNLGSPVTADNIAVASVTNDAPAQFPLGNTTVTWTVTDTSNNTATATQLVTVKDHEVPAITAPADLTDVPTDLGKAYASKGNVNLGTPVFGDNVPGTTVANDAPDQFPVNVTVTVTWTATDAAGNTATAVQHVTVRDHELPSIIAPAAVTVNADAGKTYASGVSLGTPTTGDNCGVLSVTSNAPAHFPFGSTVVTWTVTDVNGNANTATQTVTVLTVSNLHLTLVLQGADPGTTTRDIALSLGGDGSGAVPAWTTTLSAVVFNSGVATVDVAVPATGVWTQVSAKDPKHTLRMKTSVSVSNGQYVGDFTANPLQGGDLTNDGWVDILDFGVLAGQFNSTVHTYPYGARDADITGNGVVNTGDFTFIQINFLHKNDDAVVSAGGVSSAAALLSGPVQSISVVDLATKIGAANAIAADVNGDKVVNTTDVQLFLQKNAKRGR